MIVAQIRADSKQFLFPSFEGLLLEKSALCGTRQKNYSAFFTGFTLTLPQSTSA